MFDRAGRQEPGQRPKAMSGGPVQDTVGRGPRGMGVAFLDLFLPRMCVSCEESWPAGPESSWCASCLERIAWIESPLCPCCGRPYHKSPSSPDHLCGDCEVTRYPFDSARSATFHSGSVRNGIHRLKFGGRLHWVPPLVELLRKALTREMLDRCRVIVPVPLHTRRLRQRGFNQAGLLARGLGKAVGLEVDYGLLERKQWTEPQTRLKREERLRNVKGAFRVVKTGKLRGGSVLLVDDVYTTGTTLRECAAVLRQAGAEEVHAVTVSRSMPDWKPVEFFAAQSDDSVAALSRTPVS